MPILHARELTIDYVDAGAGPTVLLVPSSASGNRQWRSLIEAASDRYRFLAMNMFGYGATSAWPADRRQTMADQAALGVSLVETLAEGTVSVIGHSFGGSVALQIALALGGRLRSLALFEPNPFHLLQEAGEREAHAEGRRVRDLVKRHGAEHDWMAVAEGFAEYWVGDGAWAAMPEHRRAAFAAALPPNFDEWDTMYADEDDANPRPFGIAEVAALPCPVLLLRSERPRPAIAAIDGLLRRACPHWSFAEVASGGHMAPLARPDLVNPLLLGFLDDVHR